VERKENKIRRIEEREFRGEEKRKKIWGGEKGKGRRGR